MNKGRFVSFIITFIIWIGLNWNFDAQHLVTGILVSLFVVLITGDFFVKYPAKFMQLNRYAWFAYFVPVFLWDMLKANFDVAFRVIHPSMPIKPGIVKIKTNMKSETGIVFLANAITLRPGTLSVEIDSENGFLYIHWINVKSTNVAEATKMISERFERILTKVFE